MALCTRLWEAAGAGGGVCRVHTAEGQGGGEEVYEKAKEIIEESRTRGSLTLKGLEKKVVVDGKTHVVIGGDAEFKRGRGGKKLLKIKITAEVDGVRSEYAITFGRYARNKAEGRAYASTRALTAR
jgi:polyisoprenoid-binding protein YceI